MQKRGTHKTVLLIDDEAPFRELYRDALEHEGFRVIEAADGETGLKKIEADAPDCVILDLVVPKRHGFEILKRIRSTEPTKKIPVLILTVIGEQKYIDQGMLYGANAYAVKGLDSVPTIVAKIKALCFPSPT